MKFPVDTLQTSMVLSSEAVSSFAPFGENATALMATGCAGSVLMR
jgi:hypothetical protein